jgi:hypothetical protein
MKTNNTNYAQNDLSPDKVSSSSHDKNANLKKTSSSSQSQGQQSQHGHHQPGVVTSLPGTPRAMMAMGVTAHAQPRQLQTAPPFESASLPRPGKVDSDTQTAASTMAARAHAHSPQPKPSKEAASSSRSQEKRNKNREDDFSGSNSASNSNNSASSTDSVIYKPSSCDESGMESDTHMSPRKTSSSGSPLHAPQTPSYTDHISNLRRQKLEQQQQQTPSSPGHRAGKKKETTFDSEVHTEERELKPKETTLGEEADTFDVDIQPMQPLMRSTPYAYLRSNSALVRPSLHIPPLSSQHAIAHSASASSRLGVAAAASCWPARRRGMSSVRASGEGRSVKTGRPSGSTDW